MKDLEINDRVSLIAPDGNGDVEIEVWAESDHVSVYVQFDELEKWVAEIRREIKEY